MRGNITALPLFKHPAYYWSAVASLFIALSMNSVNAAVLTFDDIVTLGDSTTHERSHYTIWRPDLDQSPNFQYRLLYWQ
jgi:hypothetical protein